MPENQFVILVADSDQTVGIVAARLLASALDTQYAVFPSLVRVLLDQNIINQAVEPHLPPAVRNIEQQAIAAQADDIAQVDLIVGVSGLDHVRIDQVRQCGITAPAVNLCQFVLNLDACTDSEPTQRQHAQDFIVGAALQFGFGGGSAKCEICADKANDNIHYWINIADTCARFARCVHSIQTQ